MPLKFKRKLLKEPPERTVDELGRVITKEMWILNTYPDDGYPAAFNQVRAQPDSSTITMAYRSIDSLWQLKKLKEPREEQNTTSMNIEHSYSQPSACNFFFYTINSGIVILTCTRQHAVLTAL